MNRVESLSLCSGGRGVGSLKFMIRLNCVDDIRLDNRRNLSVKDKRPLCELSFKRLEEKWHNWYSAVLFLSTRRGRPERAASESVDRRRNLRTSIQKTRSVGGGGLLA